MELIYNFFIGEAENSRALIVMSCAMCSRVSISSRVVAEQQMYELLQTQVPTTYIILQWYDSMKP